MVAGRTVRRCRMVEYIMTMNSDQVFAIAGAMTVIVMALGIGAALTNFREHADTLGIAALLALILEISMVVRANPSPPGGVGTLIVFPIIDFVALCVVAYMFGTRPRVWKFVVAFAFLAQLVAHFSFWHGWTNGQNTVPVYILTLNLLAGLQKLAAGYAGACGVAIGLSAWLHDRRPAGLRSLFHEPPR